MVASLVRRAALLALLTWLVPACDPLLPPDLVGVTRDSQTGIVEVFYSRCSDELVRLVEIVVLKGNVAGDEDDRVLWRITSTHGSTENDFVVGHIPAGFSEEFPLQGDLPAGESLAVIVDTNLRPGPFQEFRLEQLRGGEVLTNDQYVSSADFASQTPEDCPA